jgi:predicted nucleic acid-binding protein
VTGAGTGCLLDTSSAVALVLTGHDAHEPMTDAVRGMTVGLAGHAWFETFSVLTRLPPPARRGPAEVADALLRGFPASVFLDVEEARGLTRRLGSLGLSGGQVYDGLVGAAAAGAGMELVTRDRRALDVYRLLGVRVRLVP